MDNNYRSRKLWFAIGTSMCIMAGGIVAALWPKFEPVYSGSIVSGLLGSLGLYLGGNLGHHFVSSKTGVKSPTVTPEISGQPVEQPSEQ